MHGLSKSQNLFLLSLLRCSARITTLDKILFLDSFQMGLIKSSLSLKRFLLQSTFLRLLTLSGILLFSTILFRLFSLLALLMGFNLFFLIGMLAWFIKITKPVPFEFVELFCKDPFLVLYFFSFFINDLLASLPTSASWSLYAAYVATWSSSSSVSAVVKVIQEP